MAQKLILDGQMTQLRKNNNAAMSGKDADFKPVVKFFMPGGAATWLITEIAADGDTMFGLCDLGHGTPELGNVSLAELSAVRGRFGLKVERDAHFKAQKTLSEYTREAQARGYISA